MSLIFGQVEIECPIEKVYDYLKNRFESEQYRSVCMMTKGYIPDINCMEEVENRHLAFYVAGRDSMLKFKIGNWQWRYNLYAVNETRTRIEVIYEWNLFMTIITCFTIRMQAANEIIETCLALEALAMK
jgi:hypothetical protein